MAPDAVPVLLARASTGCQNLVKIRFCSNLQLQVVAWKWTFMDILQVETDYFFS